MIVTVVPASSFSSLNPLAVLLLGIEVHSSKVRLKRYHAVYWNFLVDTCALLTIPVNLAVPSGYNSKVPTPSETKLLLVKPNAFFTGLETQSV